MKSRHSGFAMIIVVLACFLVTVFVVGSVRALLGRQHQQRLEMSELQCRYLAEAGLERAAARLKNDPSFMGEDWAIELGESMAVVSIAVREGKTSVVAKYMDVQITKEFSNR